MEGTALSPCLDLAYYGDFFLPDEETNRLADDDRVELDEDEVEFFAEIVHEVVDEDAEVSEVAAKGFKELPRPVGRLVAWLDKRFGVAGRVLFFGDLRQVRKYQRDDALAERVAETEMLAGLELGVVPIATALSLSTGLPVVFVRKNAKDYGTAKLAEGHSIVAKKLLVVEDVVTSGGQIVRSIKDLCERGRCRDPRRVRHRSEEGWRIRTRRHRRRTTSPLPPFRPRVTRPDPPDADPLHGLPT